MLEGANNNENAIPQKQLGLDVVVRSTCCNSDVYYAYSSYNTTMANNDGTPMDKVTVCLACGRECYVRHQNWK